MQHSSNRFHSIHWLITAAILAHPTFVAVSAAAVPSDRPVTQEQYNGLVRSMRTWTEWVKKRTEKNDQALKNGKKGPKSGDEPVDLQSLSSELSAPDSQSARPMPMFKAYFDFNLTHQPGFTSNSADLTFNNFHNFLIFEIIPTPDLQFSFEVTRTKFYELDYQITRRLQLRCGKIWIPFDELSERNPHTIFGGRVNTSRISLGPTFFPDIWADLGVAAKLKVADSSALAMDAHLYVVNGFRNTADPLAQSQTYPAFNDDGGLGADNNSDKAIGTRLHASLSNQVGFGASFYTARYSDEDQPYKRLTLFGVDGQIRLGSWTELRSGLAWSNVGVVNDRFSRGGAYAEAAQRLDSAAKWRAILRGGILQFDSRIPDLAWDQTIVGGALAFRPSMIQLMIEHSRDLKRVSSKRNYSFTNLSVVMAF